MKKASQHLKTAIWSARIALGLVFAINIHCSFVFLFSPEIYLDAFELSGYSGQFALQGLGIAFLMWNTTYPFAIIDPIKNKIVFLIILIQQFVGLMGESLLFISLSEGHEALRQSLLRFIIFDGLGLALLLAAYVFLLVNIRIKPST